MTLRGVIFDLDGTLVDTNRFHVAAWERAFAALGYDVPAERIVPQVGKGGDHLIPALLGLDVYDRDGKALRARHADAFRDIAGRERFAVLPGAVELTDRLRRDGIKTALATSSPQDLLRATLRSAGEDFTARVDVTVTADEAGASKPAPDVFEVALDKLGLPAAACVAVGDTPFDVAAARRAGMECWAVACDGCHSAAGLRAAGAAGVWRDPADLLSHLDELIR